jgi:arylformamidase
MTAAFDWRALSDAERERALSPSSCIGGDYQPFIAAYAERSFQARLATPGRLGLRYGDGPSHRLDLFVPPVGDHGPIARRPPLLVFLHGGYWQELSRHESSFSAPQAVSQGIALAVVDYTLAPEATVAEIVAECRQALLWLVEHSEDLGFDASRIVVSGSSAGAHLAAMLALPTPGVPAVQGAVLVSGIYELEPLVGTSINRALGLTAAAARSLSPALLALEGFPPAVVAWGAIETDEFKRQSLDFAARLARAAVPVHSVEVPGRNHFDVILDLVDPGTPLGEATLRLVKVL